MLPQSLWSLFVSASLCSPNLLLFPCCLGNSCVVSSIAKGSDGKTLMALVVWRELALDLQDCCPLVSEVRPVCTVTPHPLPDLSTLPAPLLTFNQFVRSAHDSGSAAGDDKQD